jgi:hypothetical protein
MVLMTRVHHDVRAVKRRSFRIVIEKRTTGGQNIPGVVEMKIHQVEPQREMDPRDGVARLLDSDELPLGKTWR